MTRLYEKQLRGRFPTISYRLASLEIRAIVAFMVPFTLYLLTLTPTIYNLDSAELTTAAATAGVTRATGYPLYLVLGWLWSLIPIGDVGYRMNLFSAVNGALTIALADRILQRWRISPWASAGAVGLLACSPFFWGLSLIAEVYTLHTALMAGLILLLLRWADDPTPLRLGWIGLMLGLSLGHHASTVLLVPGCIWYLLSVAPRRVLGPRALISGLAALLLGLSVYLYLPLRFAATPAFNYAGHYDATGIFQPVDLRTLHGFWWLVSGRAFAGEMLAYQGTVLLDEITHFGIGLWRAFFAVGVGPGLLGLVVLFRRDWQLGGALLLMFLANAIFYITYRVVDKDTMFLPAYLIWALWLGVGYHWMLTWISEANHRVSWGWSAVVLQCAMVGAVLLAGGWNWQLVNRSNDWSARERGEAILKEAEPDALIFGWWDTVPLIEYLQLVEGQRPDVQAINRFLIAPDDMRRLIASEAARRPVYVDHPTIELRQMFDARLVGTLYRLCDRQVACEVDRDH